MRQNIFKGLGVAVVTPFMEDGSVDFDALARLIDKIITTANGEPLLHEKSGFKEIAIFKNGVTL